MRSITLFILLLIASLNTMAQLKFVAHRGASYYAPENSLAAIKLNFISLILLSFMLVSLASG